MYGPGSIPGVGDVEIFSFLRVYSGPGDHAASYKMSTRGFPVVNAAERRTLLPSVLASNMWILASTSPVGLRGL